jgi:hypothetical protein
VSKRSRDLRKNKRKAEKRSRKAAKKALYLKYAEEGRRKNSKRSRRTSRSQAKKNKGSHLMADCGNAGCHRCCPFGFNMPDGERMKKLAERRA